MTEGPLLLLATAGGDGRVSGLHTEADGGHSRGGGLCGHIEQLWFPGASEGQ